jgi:virginiamycin B lyase
VAGPDGALWVTLPEAGAVARLGPDGRPEVRETCPEPAAIAATHDAVWFTAAGRLGRIPMDDVVQALELGDRGPVIAAQADGVWVGLPGAVAHVAFDGEVAELPVDGTPRGLAIGPDDALWAALDSGALARIDAA